MKKRNAEPAVMQEQRGGSWKQRLFVLFSLFAGLSVATQVFAHQYGYGEFLGPQVKASIPLGAYSYGEAWRMMPHRGCS